MESLLQLVPPRLPSVFRVVVAQEMAISYQTSTVYFSKGDSRIILIVDTVAVAWPALEASQSHLCLPSLQRPRHLRRHTEGESPGNLAGSWSTPNVWI
jgi:hypothetical protein